MRVKRTLITTKEDLEWLLEEMVNDEESSIDTESTGLEFSALPLGIPVYLPTMNEAFFVPYNYYYKSGLSSKVIAECFNKYKGTGALKVILHNAKYDWTVFERVGIDLSCFTLQDDTILMIHLLNPDDEKNLEKRIQYDFGHSKPTFKEITGCNWERLNWSEEMHLNPKTKETINLHEEMVDYACDDAYWTYRLRNFYRPKIEADEKLLNVYEKIELPLVPVLADMYIKGVNIDKEVLSVMDEVLYKNIELSKQDIFDSCGIVFNMNSPKQIAEVLFEELGYPILGYTKSGSPATDKYTLDKLADMGYDVCVKMREYSELNKLYSSYVNGIPNMLDADGRLRGNFNSTGTKTGRFSSDKPNLQNQPNNDKYPVRRAFVPAKGYKMLVADYSQIELRFMAHVSKDEKFIEAFTNGVDVHQLVADDLGITRKEAKTVNFAVLYGMTYMGLAHALKISEKKAMQIIQNYENTYKGFYAWKTQVEKNVAKYGMSRTIFGRVRRMPYVKQHRRYNEALRQGVNASVQGGAADVIKLAMIKLWNLWKEKERITAGKFQANILLQVHDELVCEAKEECIEEAYRDLIDTMENIVELRVPLIADGVISDTWAEMKSKEEGPGYLRDLEVRRKAGELNLGAVCTAIL